MLSSARVPQKGCINSIILSIMKKFILAVLATAFASVAAAGTSACEIWQKARYSWEVSAVYNVAMTDIYEPANSPSIDTYGVNLTGLYNVKDNHYATLSFTGAFGSQAGYELTTFSLAPGYRYMRPVDDKLSVFAGASLGLNISMLDYPGMKGSDYAWSSGDDMANLIFSVEAGARYAVTSKIDVVGAVMLNAGTSPFGGASYSKAKEEQWSLGVRLGVGGNF